VPVAAVAPALLLCARVTAWWLLLLLLFLQCVRFRSQWPGVLTWRATAASAHAAPWRAITCACARVRCRSHTRCIPSSAFGIKRRSRGVRCGAVAKGAGVRRVFCLSAAVFRSVAAWRPRRSAGAAAAVAAGVVDG
jgi:hypothetical protein